MSIEEICGKSFVSRWLVLKVVAMKAKRLALRIEVPWKRVMLA
jgi:hypothetical protein